MKFTIVVQKDEDCRYNVSCPDLKGCHSFGDTYEEALQNIREAIQLYLEDIPPSEIPNYRSEVKIEEIAV